MIWVEILSRHREVVARFRGDGQDVRIGRGYDNDVVVDDPFVAAHHVRVFRDETGQLVAEDTGSANGMFLDGSTSRQARIIVDGNHPLRIGHTLLRIRDTNHAVESERVMRSNPGAWPIGLAAVLGLAIAAMTELNTWLTETSEPRISSYLTPLLVAFSTIVMWAGIWALLSRIFSGRARFLPNLLVALAGILAFMLYYQFAQFVAFALTWSTAANYGYVAAWSTLAVVCFFHLREIGRSRLWLKGVLMMTLLAIAIAVQTVQQSEAFSDSGRQVTSRRLLPPALRLAPLREDSAFFADIATLKAKLDGDRPQATADKARQ